VIFEVLERYGGVATLVNDARRFRCGEGLFLLIVLTSWYLNLGLVRAIIDLGAAELFWRTPIPQTT